MSLRLVAGSANRPLAEAIAGILQVQLTPCVVERFPDGELRPAVNALRGADVYVVQPTGPPVNDHVVELMLLADACQRSGAARVTAVMPYFGYARQDRRDRAGQAVGARVVAEALAPAGVQRLIVVDPHTAALEAMCGVPVEMLTAVSGVAAALSTAIPAGSVVVAPDLGAVKLAEHYAALLQSAVAVVRKTRHSGTSVRAEELVGEVRDRPAVIVDDMISTGGTIEAAVHLLRQHSVPEVTVAATHGPLTMTANDRLSALPVRSVVVTDSISHRPAPALNLQVHSIAGLLADAIDRLHHNKVLDDLLFRA